MRRSVSAILLKRMKYLQPPDETGDNGKIAEKYYFSKRSRQIVIDRVPAGNKTYSDRNASEYAHTCFYRMAVSSICVLVVFVRYCILIQSRSRELQGAGPSLSAGKLIVLFSVAHNSAAGTDINKSSALTSRWINNKPISCLLQMTQLCI